MGIEISEQNIIPPLNSKFKKNHLKQLKLGTVFSGIGAIEQAIIQMGINHKIIFACDNDKFVEQAYKANYDPINWYKDIKEIKGNKYKDQIDLLVGGSPCQSFSLLGNRLGTDDERGLLIFDFINLISLIKPKMFIFENVKGLLNHNKGKTWKYIYGEFEKLNYKLGYQMLNAKDYGVPQSRPRLFLVGYKNKRYSVKFPKKEELKKTMFDYLEHTVNQKYYISNLGKKFVLNETRLKKKYTQVNGEVAISQTRCQQYNLNGNFVTQEYLNKYILKPKTAKFVMSEGTKNFKVKPSKNREIAHTLTSTMHKMHRSSFDNYVDFNDNIRKLTPRECLRLMGFSDNFKIVTSDTQAYRQSGNSIVVDVLKKILLESTFIKGFIKKK